ncbi:response regulator transcription factor [Rhodococcus ruber]|uniref:response regulator transcription factor n=1 Tax=Rhodococcus ruber TaxID=1830 RepID=UPI001F3EBFA0|nr:helix-turn-helix transcriptional regulator [Rhodococcus ruber]
MVLDHPGPTDAAETDPFASLTAQDRRVLHLLAQGLTNRQIGARLGLAEKTVKNYVSRILATLGVAHRTQAAILATAHALAPHRTGPEGRPVVCGETNVVSSPPGGGPWRDEIGAVPRMHPANPNTAATAASRTRDTRFGRYAAS